MPDVTTYACLALRTGGASSHIVWLALAICLPACGGAGGAPMVDGGDARQGDSGPPGSVTIDDIAPPGGFISSLAFHPTDPDVVYAGLDDSGGLCVTSDRGATWQNVPLGPEHQNWSAWAVRVAPANPSIITLGDAYGHGVLRSEDGGATWEERNSGLDAQASRTIRDLEDTPSDPNVLYIGTGRGVYRSGDGARSWQPSSLGIPEGIQVHSIAIDPTNPLRLYAGVAGGKVYRSVDGGVSWATVVDLYPEVEPGQGGDVWDLAIAPSNPGHLLAAGGRRVLHSTNGGDGWDPLAEVWLAAGDGLPVGITAAFDPRDAAVIYVATAWMNGGNKRLRSDNGGQTFSDVTSTTADEAVLRLRVSPHDSKLVLAGLAGEGVEASFDRGVTWQRHVGRPSVAAAPGAFAQAPSDPARIYLHARGVYRSDDAGRTWQVRTSPVPFSWRMVVHPADPDVVLLSSIFAGTLHLTEDGGGRWSQLPLPPDMSAMSVLFDSRAPGTIYIGTYGPGGEFGVYESNYQASSWQRLTPPSWFGTTVALGMAEDPEDAGSLLVATNRGLYASDAARTTFTLVALTGKNVNAVAVAKDGLWVVGGKAALYVQDGRASRWLEHAFPDSEVCCVLVDPDRNGRVLAGVNAVDINFTSASRPGLYRSEDRGISFEEITPDLAPSDQVFGLLRDQSDADRYLFTVYSGAGGLYRAYLP